MYTVCVQSPSMGFWDLAALEIKMQTNGPRDIRGDAMIPAPTQYRWAEDKKALVIWASGINKLLALTSYSHEICQLIDNLNTSIRNIRNVIITKCILSTGP